MEEVIRALEWKANFYDGCAKQSISEARSHRESAQNYLDQAKEQQDKADMFRAALEKLKA
jgi:hypothetical protein